MAKVMPRNMFYGAILLQSSLYSVSDSVLLTEFFVNIPFIYFIFADVFLIK